jgi:hypothetical protein
MKASVGGVALALGLLLPAVAAADDTEQTWREFRKAYPYHIQTVALSRPSNGEGGRVLIVAEPPPHATREGIERCFPRRPVDKGTGTQGIGHDGWVKDLVYTLPDLPPWELREAIDRLHDYLFFSTYKADVIDLPTAPRRGPVASEFDLHVAATDLNRWTIDDKEPFRPIEGGARVTLNDLLASRRSGVFLSQSRGLVLWSLPRAAEMARHRARARQFAMDSDLVLGAIADVQHLVIIGRERTTSSRFLPPLRVETIELLATVGTAELAQSYERNRIFAGRFDDTWDWAPIYLSPSLIDTEYGGLLNITDQMLKSWSLNGQVEYERFGYPDPDHWPFNRPIIKKLDVSELTFNWNTAGAGYAVAQGNVNVFALHRTGALPVSYIPERGRADTTGHEETAKYELEGYDYFAELGDPNLARVVQYAGLYQIFYNFGRGGANSYKPTEGQRRATQALANEVRTALTAVRTADDPRLEKVGEDIVAKIADWLAKQKIDLANERVLWTNDAKALRKLLQSECETWGESLLKETAAALADPRAWRPEDIRRLIKETEESSSELKKLLGELPPFVLRTSPSARTLEAIQLSRRIEGNRFSRRVLGTFVDVKDVKERYSAPFRERTDGWIHTPSVVISRVNGSLADGWTGGHNLDAGITRFAPTGEVLPGKVRFVVRDGKRYIEFNPADTPKVSNLVRTAGKELDNPALKTLLENRLAVAERPPVGRFVLNPLHLPDIEARGYRPENATVGKLGWEMTEQPAAPLDRFRVDSVQLPHKPVHLVERTGDAYRVLTPDGEILPAQTRTSLDELLAMRKQGAGGEAEFHLEFVGFEAEEIDGILQTIRIRNLGEAEEGIFARLTNRRAYRKTFENRLVDYDLTSAKIRQAEFRTIAEGQRAGQVEAVYHVELPAKVAGQPSLWARIRIFFSMAVGEPTEALRMKVNEVLAKFFGRDLSTPGALERALEDAKQVLAPYGVRDAILELDSDMERFHVPADESRDYIEVRNDRRRDHDVEGDPADQAG